MARERELLNNLMTELRQESNVVVELIEQVNREYCQELDELVEMVNSLTTDVEHGGINEYSEDELAYFGLKLPALMYRAGCKLAQLGSMMDLAKSKKKEAYNKTLLVVSGTVPEKKAKAEEAVANEQIIEDVYSRAYTQFNTKLDNAERLYSGIKKALSYKMKDNDIQNSQVREIR